MAPYLDTLISKLLTLLQQGKKLVQEGALTAMASVADASQEQFVRYYDAVMPLLSQVGVICVVGGFAFAPIITPSPLQQQNNQHTLAHTKIKNQKGAAQRARP